MGSLKLTDRIKYSRIFKSSDRPPRIVLHVQIEIKFLAIFRLESGSVGKIIFFSFQRNQDQVFILSGARDMIERS